MEDPRKRIAENFLSHNTLVVLTKPFLRRRGVGYYRRKHYVIFCDTTAWAARRNLFLDNRFQLFSLRFHGFHLILQKSNFLRNNSFKLRSW